MDVMEYVADRDCAKKVRHVLMDALTTYPVVLALVMVFAKTSISYDAHNDAKKMAHGVLQGLITTLCIGTILFTVALRRSLAKCNDNELVRSPLRQWHVCGCTQDDGVGLGSCLRALSVPMQRAWAGMLGHCTMVPAQRPPCLVHEVARTHVHPPLRKRSYHTCTHAHTPSAWLHVIMITPAHSKMLFLICVLTVCCKCGLAVCVVHDVHTCTRAHANVRRVLACNICRHTTSPNWELKCGYLRFYSRPHSHWPWQFTRTRVICSRCVKQ